MSSPTAVPAREYDDYNAAPTLEEVGRAVFGGQYRGQKSSLWPQDLLDIASSAGLDRSGHFLDAGCGSGWAAALLSEHFECTGEAWDVSDSNVELAREQTRSDGKVTARRRDFMDADGFEETFSLIVSVGSAYWVDQPDRLARAWRSMLRPGGSIALLQAQLRDEHGQPAALPGASSTAAGCDWGSTFSAVGLRVVTMDHTDRFTTWLTRWLEELDERRERLVPEMGEAGFAEFRARFSSMAEAAATGRLRRTVVIARSEDA